MWGQPPSALLGAKSPPIRVREARSQCVPSRVELRSTDSRGGCPYMRGVLTGATLWALLMRYPFPWIEITP